jgi:hypothetical protein
MPHSSRLWMIPPMWLLMPRSPGSAIISTWELCNGAFNPLEFGLSVLEDETSLGDWISWTVWRRIDTVSHH